MSIHFRERERERGEGSTAVHSDSTAEILNFRLTEGGEDGL
jgi:hypothetical protein